MPRASKQFKKFASSGKLTDTIKKRRQVQQSRRKQDEREQRRAKQRGAPRAEHMADDDDEDDDEKESRGIGGGKAGGVARTVDELFGEGVEESDEGEEEEDDDEDEDEEEDDEGEDPEDEGMTEEAMEKAMKDLQKKDPEFFKFLQENDKELLDFRQAGEEDDEDEDEEMEVDEDEDEDEIERKVTVTMRMLRGWQEGLVKQKSIRSLRKTLLAFRAAAHMNEDGETSKYTIDNPLVFNKLVVTALKYTPVVLAQHMPFKTLPQGKIKLQPSANPRLNRLILSHFSTLMHLIKSLPSTPSSLSSTEDAGLLGTAVAESAKLLPWILGARKHLKAYLKVLLDLWGVASDSVRIAAFLAVRKTFVAGDDAIKDLCLRNIYRALLPPLRLTSVHTLPSINLMKNSASELYQLAPALSYQHAFQFIRMLAVHLRSVVRAKPGEGAEAFKAVYNWQFVHCIDFWCTVLAGAVSGEVQRANAGLESPLKPLVYPLAQIALGVVRLLPSSRYFPLRFHILHSLIRLVSQTDTYIPLSPFLLEILDSTEFRSNPKKSTLKPLDLEYAIRAPAAYPKTRVYQETLVDELSYLLGDYHSTLATNIAFPELTLPVIMAIRRHIKKGTAGAGKSVATLKTLVDKLEAQRVWVEGKRRGVSFAPRDKAEVERFGEGVKVESTPLGGWMRIQRKVRAEKRVEVEKALREE